MEYKSTLAWDLHALSTKTEKLSLEVKKRKNAEELSNLITLHKGLEKQVEQMFIQVKEYEGNIRKRRKKDAHTR